MDEEKYLKRINFAIPITIDDKTLAELHEHHVYNVPFENIDIHYKKPFDLAIESIYQKVIINHRGGFCYELNNIFNTLLRQIGFDSRIISARIIDDDGRLGPEYDHMAICIELDDKKYLADVGYGDLFIKPLEIKEGIQYDGRNQFIIQKANDHDFVLLMSSDNVNFQKKYQFNLNEVSVENFHGICLDKQTSPSSYFVKNTICTKPTKSGRVTVWNGSLIVKNSNERTAEPIHNDEELQSVLKSNFDIVIN